jgi:hypothetical protein
MFRQVAHAMLGSLGPLQQKWASRFSLACVWQCRAPRGQVELMFRQVAHAMLGSVGLLQQKWASRFSLVSV